MFEEEFEENGITDYESKIMLRMVIQILKDSKDLDDGIEKLGKIINGTNE